MNFYLDLFQLLSSRFQILFSPWLSGPWSLVIWSLVLGYLLLLLLGYQLKQISTQLGLYMKPPTTFTNLHSFSMKISVVWRKHKKDGISDHRGPRHENHQTAT